MPGSMPATSQLDWLSSTTAMIVLFWSRETRDLLRSFGWGIAALHRFMLDPEGRAPAGVVHMVIYGIPGDVKGFAEGELSKESEKFVGGKSTMEKNTYWGPGTPPNTDWHHYTFILMATDLEPKDPALKPGMTRDELAAALGVGTPNSHVKDSAGLVTRFKHL